MQNGATQKQKYTGAYTVNADGSGSITFVPPSGLAPGSALLGLTSRTLAISATGHLLIAGAPDGHDILLGVRAAATDNITAASFNGRYWVSGLEVDSTGSSLSEAGAATVISAGSSILSAERVHQSATPNRFYSTSAGSYQSVNVATGGTVLSAGSTFILPGAGNTLLTVQLGIDGNSNPAGTEQFSLGIGQPEQNVTGTGVFVNPQGIVNAAGNSPAVNPISPGEFIAIYGSGLAAQTVVAAPPYPTTLGNVSVSIGGLPAPLYLVSAGQINCLVPYGVATTGGTVTVIVNNNGTVSNTVAQAVSATAPGIFSNNLSGTGEGAIVHLNNTLVSANNPAVAGETLTIYLTGLGALQTPITDGNAPNPPAADSTAVTVQVAVDGVLSPNVLYAGINPVYPGLYQINFRMPQVPDHGGLVSVAIATPDARSSQISLFAQ